MAKYLFDIIKHNDLVGGHYVEPYAGGAGAALEVLFSGIVSHIHINDIDPGVYAFWKAVVEQPDALSKLILDTNVSMEEWHKQKKFCCLQKNMAVLTWDLLHFF